MKCSLIRSLFAAAVVVAFSGGLSCAAEDKARPSTTAAPDAKAAASDKTVRAKKPAAKVKVVDLNSATKAELKAIPGIGDAEADGIIAARPHLTKANLVTRKIIPQGVYLQIKDRVIARPPQSTGKGAAKSR
jgi:DNA uptake protein ComE-like DNA-binding protein